jgi:hypothetical protein
MVQDGVSHKSPWTITKAFPAVVFTKTLTDDTARPRPHGTGPRGQAPEGRACAGPDDKDIP